jgi:hypothetical protein
VINHYNSICKGRYNFAITEFFSKKKRKKAKKKNKKSKKKFKKVKKKNS